MEDAEAAGVNFVNSDLFEFQASKFDVIVDFGLLHHLVPADWRAYADQIRGLLTSNGLVFIKSFHVDDKTWPGNAPGGYIRKEYYCHYHDAESMSMVFSGDFTVQEVVRYEDDLHVESLFKLRRNVWSTWP